MKRLYLTVEGQTEEVFARDVLGPHLAAFDVILHAPRFTGPHGRRKGRIPRGGMFSRFEHALQDIRRWLKEDKSPEARFSMMVDLYSLPPDFPGYAQGMSQAICYQQAAVMEAALAKQLADPRFIPYLQVHEFEALVLVDPQRLTSIYEDRDQEIAALVAECSRFLSPEEINHGPLTHPKRRIKNAIEEYDENVAGPLITYDIGINRLRQKCQHFNQWVTQLEQLDMGDA